NKTVHLQPLMTIVGDHANNDMAGEYEKGEADEDQSWKWQLEKMGWKVKTHMKGLGDYPEINKIYLEHLKEAIANGNKE
ncbi:sirohydrochlorin cobaltochelatase, partial [Porphyromonas somerae]|uniref:sirohydrochlorin cobaltochelatase n=1 Tax=Porphyromonas somerae TaxID=322095 RepID=UPI002A814FF2